MSDQSLGTKIGGAVRQAASDQAEAYTKYAALLERFSNKEVDFLNFGRDALDIYADAVRDFTQVGGRITNDAVTTGISKVKSLRFVKAATAATEDVAGAITADATDAVTVAKRGRGQPKG